MKRPAADPPEVEPLRVRRHYEPQQLASGPMSVQPPRPNGVSDDEEFYPPVQTLPKVDTSTSQVVRRRFWSGLPDTHVDLIRVPRNVNTLAKGDGVGGASIGRRLPRLKLLIGTEPSPCDTEVETDSTVSFHTDTESSLNSPPDSPLSTPTGLRAPPCSPVVERAVVRKRRIRSGSLSGLPAEEEEERMEIDRVKRSASPISVFELNEPNHRPPTPPYYVQHFEEAGFSPFEGDNNSIALAGRNANTFVRKPKFTRPNKRQKGKGPWAFKDHDEYPRGETPTIEEILGIEEEVVQPKKDETSSESEEDEEVSRDPGIATSLTVGIDGSGRFLCKWGACDKSFARNDHLGRHVRVSHLRVRKHRCDPCGMAFIGIKGLRNHEKTHNTNQTASEAAVSAAVSIEEDQEADAEGEVDVSFRKQTPSLSYPISAAYMFEPDGEEET